MDTSTPPIRYRVVDRRKRPRPGDYAFQLAIEREPFHVEYKRAPNPRIIGRIPRWLPVPGAHYPTRAGADQAADKMRRDAQ